MTWTRINGATFIVMRTTICVSIFERRRRNWARRLAVGNNCEQLFVVAFVVDEIELTNELDNRLVAPEVEFARPVRGLSAMFTVLFSVFVWRKRLRR